MTLDERSEKPRGCKAEIAAQRIDNFLLPASTLQAPNGNVMNEGVNYSIG
jgi:hypothetical protein